jgi:hypothetical protein
MIIPKGDLSGNYYYHPMPSAHSLMSSDRTQRPGFFDSDTIQEREDGAKLKADACECMHRMELDTN